MAYRLEQNEIVIDGWHQGIAPSPYLGIANIRGLNSYYYSGVAYVNYKRKAATLAESGTFWYAGANSTSVSDNTGWLFEAQPSSVAMTNPVGKAISPTGLIYILDDSGQVWKQSAVNSSTFNLLGDVGRYGNGNKGIAYWQNYLVVFGDGLIEWCGDGTGDSTIISGNWNLNTDASQVNNTTFTTDYASLPARLFITGSTYNLPVFNNGDMVTFSTTGTLPAPLTTGTVYYLAINGAQTFVSLRQQDTIYYLSSSVSSGATSATLVRSWDGTTGSYVIVFSDLEERAVTLTNGSSAVSWSGGLSSNVTANIQICVELTSDGTGTHTVTDIQNILPLGNYTDLNVYISGSAPFSTFTLNPGSGYYGSYVDTRGETVTGMWKGPSGIFQIILPNGQKVDATFANNSPTITITGGVYYFESGANWSIQFIDTTVTDYRPYVSKVDGNLYFANGRYLGTLQLVTNGTGSNLNFSPSLSTTYNSNYGIVAVGDGDSITDMTDLNTSLIISSKIDVQTWDYVSNNVTAPVPIKEPIHRIANVLNTIYLLAGQKGNIYVSNGYSVQLLTKIPDYVCGNIDPVWSWGDLMFHRARLYFQALAQDTSGNNLLAGVFSLLVSPSLLGETASGLIMEAQNSYGLVPPVGSLSNALLIDNEPSADGQDSYYSVWSNGATSGGIDYNDTTLWSNNEPVIETDIIPIGTILDKKTLGQAQFKLDRPMVSGDTISLYARSSLSDTYTLIGTSSTAQLSEYFPSNLAQEQWLQFKITFKCASSGSSRIPLREVRIQIT